MNLRDSGYTLFQTKRQESVLGLLRDRLFREGQAGTRCLLDEPIVRDAVSAIREELAEAKLMPTNSPAIQAIAFDKSPSANWKVTWHQDLMFPFARPATRPGFDLQSKKDGVDYARPPTAILEELLAVRLHLDDCGVSNGPLRVSPGTHNLGVLRRAEVQGCVAKNGEVVCVANEGNALIMRPLLLHASSPAIEPRHRRVLHIVFYSGMPISEQWFREV